LYEHRDVLRTKVFKGLEVIMSPLQPEKFDLKIDQKENKGVQKQKKIVISMDTEDIIAVFAGVVALIFAIGMFIGRIPTNKLTVGVLGFSGIGIVISQIIKARNKRQKRIEK
jgi:hypothetical protein